MSISFFVSGRFGNNLFQYFATKVLGKILNKEYIFNGSKKPLSRGINGEKIKDAGLPINLHSYPQCRLLSYNLTDSKEYYSKYLTNNYRCAVCGELYEECRSINAEEETKIKHVFSFKIWFWWV